MDKEKGFMFFYLKEKFIFVLKKKNLSSKFINPAGPEFSFHEK